jgi:hypothetical protein
MMTFHLEAEIFTNWKRIDTIMSPAIDPIGVSKGET